MMLAPAPIATLNADQVAALLQRRPMAISLWQPWATLIALGIKRYETRHWQIGYRGDILIHAAKKWDTEVRQYFNYLMNSYPQLADHFPGWREKNYAPVLGAFVCVAQLTDIDPTEELKGTLPSLELALGNFRPRRYGWLMTNVRPFAEPMTAKGQQGVWQVSAPDTPKPPRGNSPAPTAKPDQTQPAAPAPAANTDAHGDVEEALHKRNVLVRTLTMQAPHATYSQFALSLYTGNLAEFAKWESYLQGHGVDTSKLTQPPPKAEYSQEAAYKVARELDIQWKHELDQLYGAKEGDTNASAA